MPKQSKKNATDQFMDLLQGVASETGHDLSESADRIRTTVAEQMAKLSLVVGEPGYDRAVKAARDNVALAAGLAAVEDADAADGRIIGVIQGALFFGAKTLA